jgi:hypothetical protein
VDVLANAPAVGTPTYCHGLAGQLELWRMLSAAPRFAELAEAQAGKAARALRILNLTTAGRRIWASDKPEIVTPDLWVGFLGPATALAMHAAQARHALLSPFWLRDLCAGAQSSGRRNRPGRGLDDQLDEAV